MLRNYIQENWQPRFESDQTLCSLRAELHHVLEAYERGLSAYQDATDDKATDYAEQWLLEKTLSYNAHVFDLEQDFATHLRMVYGIHLAA